MSNDLTSRLVADHALLIEKRLQDWQDGFRAGQEAMREAAAKYLEEESAELRASCEPTENLIMAHKVHEYVHTTLREGAAAIRSLPIKDAPDD